MEDYTIKNLPDLLSESLGANKEIVDVCIKKLPQNGYGSIMLKVDLKIKNKNGGEETEYVVAKILPDSEIVRKMFNIQVTYKNEIAFYNTVLPTLKDFQKENGITDVLDMFAKFYGARINLDNSDVVTNDAVLVLENLVESGFKNSSRQEGFDFDTAKLILTGLATFHGTALALKFKRPIVFEKKIKASCKTFDFQTNDIKVFFEALKLVLQENTPTAPLAKLATSFFDKSVPKPREPFATITHCDLWVNNMMQKIEEGKVVKNIFVDFQVCDYRSCASDVFFFLWTSVQKDIVAKELDTLIHYYYDNLISTLQELKCDTTGFSLEAFYDDIKHEAEYEFGHALMFAFMVKNPKFADTSIEDNKAKPIVPEEIAKIVPNFLKEYLWFMTLECHKRGWLY